MSATLLVTLLVLVPTATTTPTPPAPIHFPALVNVPAWMNPARTPTRVPTATDMRTTLRPDTCSALAAALRVPGALVLPVPGGCSGDFRMGAGTTLDGKGLVTLHSGLLLQGANGATVRGIRIDRAQEDAISIVKTGGWVLIERVDLTGAGDGVLDVVRSDPAGLVVTVRDSVLRDDEKCSLLGHFSPGLDENLTVYLENVSFINCDARSPKTHKGRIFMTGGLVSFWGSRAVDVQLGGSVTLSGVTFREGPMSGPRLRTETGGTVRETGTVIVPWEGGF